MMNYLGTKEDFLSFESKELVEKENLLDYFKNYNSILFLVDEKDYRFNYLERIYEYLKLSLKDSLIEMSTPSNLDLSRKYDIIIFNINEASENLKNYLLSSNRVVSYLETSRFLVFDTFSYPLNLISNYLNESLNHLSKVDVISSFKSNVVLFDKLNKPLYKNINRDTSKGNYPHVSIIGGSKKYKGAPYLSYLASTSLYMGASFTYLCVLEEQVNSLVYLDPQVICIPLKEKGGVISFNKETLNEIISKSEAISFGQGVCISKEGYKIISYLLNNFKGRLILDADGINCLSKYGRDILNNHSCKLILTPHLGEFARLINKDVSEVKNNALELAKSFALKYKLTLLLKSASSIITDGKFTYINKEGNTGLAKAGSGDILDGIILGLVDQFDSDLELAATSSYILGRCASLAKENYLSERNITYRDILIQLKNI